MAVEDPAQRELPQRPAGLDVAVHHWVKKSADSSRTAPAWRSICSASVLPAAVGRVAVDVLDHPEHDALLRAETGVGHDRDAPLLAGRPVGLPVLVEQRWHARVASCSAGAYVGGEAVVGDPVDLGDRGGQVDARADRRR